jgi:hypothetical protein
MTEFLNALKADLLERQMRPLLAAAGVALAAALGYAALAGGSTTAPPEPLPRGSSAAVRAGLSGIPITQAPPNPNAAVAETPSGAVATTVHQRGGAVRNPFTPLPSPPAPAKATVTPATGTTPAGSTSAGSSAKGGTAAPSAGSGSSSKSSAGTAPAPTPKSAPPAKPKTVYDVSVLFGIAAPGTPSQSAQLKSYPELTRKQPLPSAKQPLVVFRGVTAGGKSATFTLVGEAILHGGGKCLPNPAQCEAIELAAGKTEEFEYQPPGAAPVTYRLELVAITASKASAAAAKAAYSRESKVGGELLRRIGRVALPFLHYSRLTGVLALASPPAPVRRPAIAKTALADWGAITATGVVVAQG